MSSKGFLTKSPSDRVSGHIQPVRVISQKFTTCPDMGASRNPKVQFLSVNGGTLTRKRDMRGEIIDRDRPMTGRVTTCISKESVSAKTKKSESR